MSVGKSPSLIVVTGPTASGKTSLAIELANVINAEIINADSIQVYKHFDIGSAKPNNKELAAIPHHLISFLEPDEEFNAGIFIKRAKIIIDEIASRGKNIIICGGTGLYLKALIHGLLELDNIAEEVEADFERATALLKENSKDIADYALKLYQWLVEVDSDAIDRINPSDHQRVSRAILVKLATGKSIFELQREHANKTINYLSLTFCLLPPREFLYDQINKRVEQMIAQGLVEETKQIIDNFGYNVKALNSIGYLQAVRFLKNELSKEEMISDIQKQTRRFAKRQYTWWKHQPDILKWQRVGATINSFDQIRDNSQKFLDKISPFNNQQVFIQEIATN
ncbi:MAG: tRNA (adenosine(37)-N6)-dimethylallyltransferase MiaA [Proteobacteria bacterium]|nr:tRNA (adenosine(37)-N6)-dimethylallyltransferase MiaA [Pseudomonadota bacterium]